MNTMKRISLTLFVFLLPLILCSLPASAQDLKLTEEMITRYLAVYDQLIASSPKTAERLFHNEPIEPGTPESAVAEGALKKAGFADLQEFAAADITIGTAWLQLTAQEMAATADEKKREAVQALEDALQDPQIRGAQRTELEQALERMQNEGQPAGIASDADLIDSSGMELLRSHREKLRPVMNMGSGNEFREF
ncbi:MAG TPA: hypothetical protein PKM25_03790 [Candidatus Ozemobacteraceae bacterium]|nr:hypothetical protein [Candidatus Ozemobacteraceae bacterium]